MRIDYNYRKIFDNFSKKNKQYKKMNIILNKIAGCYSSLSVYQEAMPRYIEKLFADFEAIGCLIQYFFVLQALALVRIQVETVCKFILQKYTTEDLSAVKTDKIKKIFNIPKDTSMINFVIARCSKKLPESHGLKKMLDSLKEGDFNKFAHANLRNDMLGLQCDGLMIEDYVLGTFNFKNHPFPYGKYISEILYVQVAILYLILFIKKDYSKKTLNDVTNIRKLVYKFTCENKELIFDYESA